MKITRTKTLLSTPFLAFVQIDYIDHNGDTKKWFGVRRANSIAAVAVAAITTDDELIFVKQNRPMVGGKTIEFPAGLMDVPGETVLDTAKRELLEETGYAGGEFQQLVGGSKGLTTTAGVTDERLYFVLATGVKKVAEPLTDEGTEPILVPLRKAFERISKLVDDGEDVDYKLFGGIRLIESEVQNGGAG